MKPYFEDFESGITIYCGDCRKILPAIDVPAAAVWAFDPPYGIQHSSSYGASWENTQIANDHSTELRDWIIAAAGPRPMFVFGTWKIAKPVGTRQTLIWDKGPAFGMGDLSLPWKNSFEEIHILGNGWRGRRGEAVLHGHMVVSWESRGRVHSHQKPVSLLSEILKKSPKGIVVDPCMGSGSSLIAAKLSGRRAIGIELEERYCEIAANRLAQGVLWGAEASA